MDRTEDFGDLEPVPKKLKQSFDGQEYCGSPVDLKVNVPRTVECCVVTNISANESLGSVYNEITNLEELTELIQAAELRIPLLQETYQRLQTETEEAGKVLVESMAELDARKMQFKLARQKLADEKISQICQERNQNPEDLLLHAKELLVDLLEVEEAESRLTRNLVWRLLLKNFRGFFSLDDGNTPVNLYSYTPAGESKLFKYMRALNYYSAGRIDVIFIKNQTNSCALNVQFIVNCLDSIGVAEASLNTKQVVEAIIKKVAQETDKVDKWPAFFELKEQKHVNWRKIIDIYFPSGRSSDEAKQWFRDYCQLHYKMHLLDGPEENSKFVKYVNHTEEMMGRYFIRIKFRSTMAALMVKLYDSLDLPSKPPLSNYIYKLAKPVFELNWGVWCRRLSLCDDLAGIFPNAIRGETITDSDEQYQELLANTDRYFLDGFNE